MGRRAAERENFTIKKYLGKGAFGTVYEVEHDETGERLAMKCQDKDTILNYTDINKAKRSGDAEKLQAALEK